MKNVLMAFLLMLFVVPVWGQLVYEERVEIDLKDGFSNEEVYEFNEYGFVLKAIGKKAGGLREWKFDFYDVNLQKTKTVSKNLSAKLKVAEVYKTEEYFYILLTDKKSNFVFLTIDGAKQEVSQIYGVLPRKTVIKKLAVFKDKMYLAGVQKRKSPSLITIDLKTKEQKRSFVEVKGIKPKNVSLLGFEVLEDAEEVLFYTRTKISKTDRKMYVSRIDSNGDIQGQFEFGKEDEYSIVNITGFKVDREKYCFTGTYANKGSVESKGSIVSKGMFFSVVEDEKIKKINFYNFLDLDNFLNYLSEKKQAKIKRKKKRKEKRGKELKTSYYIANHNIIPTDSGYLLLGEAYYPTYRSESHTTTTSDGKTSTSYLTVFDGYFYTHAILSKFDFDGELDWDVCFEMRPSNKPFKVKRFIALENNDDGVLKLAFANKDKIVSKVFDLDGTVLQDEESEEIETGEGDNEKWTIAELSYWYDNYFLNYGFQKIKNEDAKKNKVKRRRKVFFMSKIKFDIQ